MRSRTSVHPCLLLSYTFTVFCVFSLYSMYFLAEEGDYDEEEHQAGYVSKHKMLPKQTNKQEEKIAEIHKKQLRWV